MKKLFIFLLLLIPLFGMSQSNSDNQVFLSVEQMPEYPGGEEQLFKFIQTNLLYPSDARAKNITGIVYVAFVVGKEGLVEDIKILKSVDPALDVEAMRVIKLLPKWKPGYQNGKAARVQYQVPIKFKITEPLKENK